MTSKFKVVRDVWSEVVRRRRMMGLRGVDDGRERAKEGKKKKQNGRGEKERDGTAKPRAQ